MTLLDTIEALGYRLGERLRHERSYFGALLGVWFICGRGYKMTDVRDDNMYSTIFVCECGRPLSRKMLASDVVSPLSRVWVI